METTTIPPAAEEIPPLSNVNIPIRLNSTEIEALLNKKLSGVIYEDSNLEDDGMLVKATKSGPITLHLEGLQMSYRVPLKIWVFKRLFGSRGVETEGDLALTFRTSFSINDDWSIAPHTDVTGYEWITPPILKTGLVDIPVKYVANAIIDQSKNKLAVGIDNAIRTNLDIKKNLQDMWNTMQVPVKTAGDYNTWVKMTPQTISMTPFRSSGNQIESTVSVSSIVEVVSSPEQPIFRANSPLPPFRLGKDMADSFAINLTTDIPMKEAEGMAKKFTVGQTFNPAGKTITVTDVKLFTQDDKLVINSSFEGSYRGSLYLTGKPAFDPIKSQVEMQGLDYELQTKNFLLNTARWLFDKQIVNKLRESMVFPTGDKVQTMKTMLNEMLKGYKFNNNVTMSGFIQDLRVTNVVLFPDKIRIYITSIGKLNMEVSGLDGY